MFEGIIGIISREESFEERYNNSYIHPTQGNGIKRKEYTNLSVSIQKKIKKIEMRENGERQDLFNGLELELGHEVIGITFVKGRILYRVGNPSRPSHMYDRKNSKPKL